MDPYTRQMVVRSRIDERLAQASRARLVKGDPFANHDSIVAPTQPVAAPSLLGRLIGLKLRVAHRSVVGSVVAPSH